jgi:hypothetical protein
MVGTAKSDDERAGALRVLTEGTLALYSADDWDALRSTMALDCEGFDHRRIGLGRFDVDELLAYLEGLSSQVRSHFVTLLWHESRGNTVIFAAVDTAETHDGTEVSIGLIVVCVLVDGLTRTQHMFDPEQENEARTLFGKLAAADGAAS